MMENMEEIFHFLEDFSKRKPKVIPQELNEYLAHVARTGDPVYQWALVKSLFKEKLLNVITDFYDTTPSIEIPPYPNVDPFNYDAMKNSLLERLDSFSSAPFTVQRICELLTFPRKQYNRVDKFMRAVEKNILVVSTREPGLQRHAEPENGEPAEPIVNGSDNNSEYNVDVEMEDMSWKENAEQQPPEPQPSSSETHIFVDDIEARLNAKQEDSMAQDKLENQYESVTPPELNVTNEEQETKISEDAPPTIITTEESSESTQPEKEPHVKITEVSLKIDEEMEPAQSGKESLVIPEIKVDDVEMTEQRLAEESSNVTAEVKDTPVESVVQDLPEPEKPLAEEKVEEPQPPQTLDESSSDMNMKEETEQADSKILDVLTSSEESSSSDNTDGNSNSPKMESQSDSQESSSDTNLIDTSSDAESKPEAPQEIQKCDGDNLANTPQIESENYSISDVSSDSELPQPASDIPKEVPEAKELSEDEPKEGIVEKKTEEPPKEVSKTEPPVDVVEASVESDK